VVDISRFGPRWSVIISPVKGDLVKMSSDCTSCILALSRIDHGQPYIYSSFGILNLLGRVELAFMRQNF